jgi:NAD-dependent SIR2 family protein deacetylase
MWLKNNVFLTGAGISVAAGISTFRGPDGVYTRFPEEQVLEVMSQRGKKDWPIQYTSLMKDLFASALMAEPTDVHRAIHTAWCMNISFDDERTQLFTQNIDGLHERCGTPTTRLHGDILNPVLFGDPIPGEECSKWLTACEAADQLFIVGTSMPFGYLQEGVMLAMLNSADIFLLDPNENHILHTILGEYEGLTQYRTPENYAEIIKNKCIVPPTATAPTTGAD